MGLHRRVIYQSECDIAELLNLVDHFLPFLTSLRNLYGYYKTDL